VRNASHDRLHICWSISSQLRKWRETQLNITLEIDDPETYVPAMTGSFLTGDRVWAEPECLHVRILVMVKRDRGNIEDAGFEHRVG